MLRSLMLLGYSPSIYAYCEALWVSNISSAYSSSPGLSEVGNAISSLSFTLFGISGLLMHYHSNIWYINMNLCIWLGITSFLHHWYFSNNDWAMYADVTTLQLLIPLSLYQIISVIKKIWWKLYITMSIIITLALVTTMTIYRTMIGPRYEILFSSIGCIISTQIPICIYFFKEKKDERWDVLKSLVWAGLLFIMATTLWFVDKDCPKWMRGVLNGHAFWHIGVAWSLFSTLNISNLLYARLNNRDIRWISPFKRAKWFLFIIKIIPSKIHISIEKVPLTSKPCHRRAITIG
jgi:hypothetical protein